MAEIDIVTSSTDETPIGTAVPFPQIRKVSTVISDSPVQLSDGNSSATPIDPESEEAAKDEFGYTNPNLHRRIETPEYRDKGVIRFNPTTENQYPDDEEIESQDLNPDVMPPNEYSLRIQSVYSYRTTSTFLHDDELDGGPGSGETEIP